MHQSGSSPIPRQTKSKKKTNGRVLSDDEADDNPTPTNSSDKPWLKEFNDYLRSPPIKLGNLSIVRWWGVSNTFLDYERPF